MHIPVLQKEVLQYLYPRPNQSFIDATVGGAGHTLAILEKNAPQGRVLAIDRDPEIIENCKVILRIENFKERVILVCENFTNLKEIVARQNFEPVHGILFDLGFSSWHLEGSGRGFSFLHNEHLDMRYDKNSELTAERIVNVSPQEEIEKILREYGEERFARRISKEIVEARKKNPIKTTFQLVEIINKAVPGWYQHKRIHFATKTFQAIRIAVNDELDNLEKALPQALDILTAGGRLTIISFHSLEDHIVKCFLKSEKDKEMIRILTKKPVRPSDEEIKINPRARSAKLRAAVKL